MRPAFSSRSNPSVLRAGSFGRRHGSCMSKGSRGGSLRMTGLGRRGLATPSEGSRLPHAGPAFEQKASPMAPPARFFGSAPESIVQAERLPLGMDRTPRGQRLDEQSRASASRFLSRRQRVGWADGSARRLLRNDRVAVRGGFDPTGPAQPRREACTKSREPAAREGPPAPATS